MYISILSTGFPLGFVWSFENRLCAAAAQVQQEQQQQYQAQRVNMAHNMAQHGATAKKYIRKFEVSYNGDSPKSSDHFSIETYGFGDPPF